MAAASTSVEIEIYGDNGYRKFLEGCRALEALQSNVFFFSGCQGLGKSSLLKKILKMEPSIFCYTTENQKIPGNTTKIFVELDNRPSGKDLAKLKAYLKANPPCILIGMGCTDGFYTPAKKLSAAGAFFTDLGVKSEEVKFFELCRMDESIVYGLVQRIVKRFQSDKEHVLSKAVKGNPVRFAYEIVTRYLKERGGTELLSEEVSESFREQLKSSKCYSGLGWVSLGKAIFSNQFVLYKFPEPFMVHGRAFGDVKSEKGLTRVYLNGKLDAGLVLVFSGIELTPDEITELQKLITAAIPADFNPANVQQIKSCMVPCFPADTFTPGQIDKKTVGMHSTCSFGATLPDGYCHPKEILFSGVLISLTGHMVVISEQKQSDGKTPLHISLTEGNEPFECY